MVPCIASTNDQHAHTSRAVGNRLAGAPGFCFDMHQTEMIS